MPVGDSWVHGAHEARKSEEAMKGVWNPEKYCPICGDRLMAGHWCRQSVLNGIDGARDKRDPDSVLERSIPYGRRLSDGMDTLHSDSVD